MTATVQIMVMRHGEKDHEELTAYGAQQVWAAVAKFDWHAFRFQRLVCAGTKRTWQAATVAKAALGLEHEQVVVGTEFDFKTTVEEVFGPGGKSLHELPAIKVAGGTVGAALARSAYARLARERVTEALRRLALDMVEQKWTQALVVSSSPYFECAAHESTPYSLGEADAILFTISADDGAILATEFRPAPLPGKAK